MELSSATLYKVLVHYNEHDSGEYINDAEEYGEPGYDFPHDATLPVALFSNWWCKCGKAGLDDLHSRQDHHPRLWAQLESQGVQCEWSDEWYVDHDYSGGKAWRTQSDSHSWQPSLSWSDGGVITLDDDVETVIEWALDEPTQRCIPERFVRGERALEYHGFVTYEANDPKRYESGWHPHQTDDPRKVYDEIQRWHGPDAEVVFVLDEASQFYVGWSAYYRTTDEPID